MARKKVKLGYIANSSIRRATFRKRCRSLLKKVQEIATLCDVKACAVIYEPWEAQPEVWPNEQEARVILQQVEDLPHLEQSKKFLNQDDFICNRMAKQQERLSKVRVQNHELELEVLMLRGLCGESLHDLKVGDLSALDYFVQLQKKGLQEQIYKMQSQMNVPTSSSTAEMARARGDSSSSSSLAPRSSWGLNVMPVPNISQTVDTLAQQLNWGMDLMPTSSTDRVPTASFTGTVGTGGLEDITRPYVHGSWWCMDGQEPPPLFR